MGLFRRDRRRPAQGGQIIVLFVLSLTAMFAMAALLFDGAQALVQRRQQQNASDTAALAAANLIQSVGGCSATASPPGAPRTAITNAAVAAVQSAIAGTPTSAITVSCPGGTWGNYAVQVDLAGHSQTFFGGAVGMRGFDVRTTSQAVNGPVAPAPYSVLLLDPYNASFANGKTGCPAALISGGPTITLEGSMMIDSNCQDSVGPLGTNGNSATLTFNNGAVIKMVGTYKPGALTISPTPQSGQKYVKDPLAGLTAMSSSLTVRATSKQTYNSGDVVLEPGIYQGGIQLKNSVKAFLHPGVYVMQGGGFDIGAQNEVYSVASGVSSTTSANWATDCPTTTCGVLMYNTGTASGSGAMGSFSIGAGATLKLRPYNHSYDGSGLNGGAGFADYDNLLFWQSASPLPTATYSQPQVSLSGGGNVDISGTVYAPSALVYMTGGSGGSGGGTDLTLQFICWDLQIQGNSAFHFYYNNTKFAKPPDYGLIK